MLVIGVPYEVRSVEHDPEKYDLPTVVLHRADGQAGWLKVTGPGADELKVGGVVRIVVVADIDPSSWKPLPPGNPED